MRLAGKTALITGGTTGIGFAAARLMIAEGAQVAICGRETERLREASKALGAQAKIYRADLRSLSDIRRLAKDVGDWTDQLDILLLNAGISRPAEFSSVDEAFFEDHVAINIKGPFFVLQQLLGRLGANASVVMTTSCLDEMGRPGMSVYAATKAALRSLVRSLGAELVERGIRVNAVAPGPIDTGIHAKMGVQGDALVRLREKIVQEVPMHRFGVPLEIAEAVLFLASDASSFVTGHELVVDGGWSSF
jgi:NAD(P)-dependent dehydrogenase (short-subunit alcohol dehydrogenase family)